MDSFLRKYRAAAILAMGGLMVEFGTFEKRRLWQDKALSAQQVHGKSCVAGMWQGGHALAMADPVALRLFCGRCIHRL